MNLYNLELEAAVIGSILIDPYCLPDVMASLPTESFYSPENRSAYTVIAGLYQNGSEIDFLTVSDKLNEQHPGHDWLTMLATLARNVPSSANVLTYANAVRQYHYLRKVYFAGEEVCRSALSDGDLSERIAAAQTAVGQVLNLEVGKGVVSTKEALKEWIEHLSTAHERSGSGLSTGFAQLDDITLGFKPGELIILAARPGQGKTVFALQIAGHAVKAGHGVLFFSLEMQTRELISRLVSCQSGTMFRNIQTGDLDAEQWERITQCITAVQDKGLYIDDRGDQNIDELRAVARSEHNKHHIDLVVVDYLQLVNGDGESDVVRVGNVSKNLKAMAKELNCPVLALSQFSRSVEQRADGRPKLSDLRSSGQIEQDADVVMMLHKADDQTTELIIEKNRHGRTGSVWLTPRFEYMRFSPGQEPVRIEEQPKKRGMQF